MNWTAIVLAAKMINYKVCLVCGSLEHKQNEVLLTRAFT